MKTVRTVQQVVERDEDMKQQPKYGIGDYVQVYYGSYENQCFWVKDIRFNHDRRMFEYSKGVGIMGGWLSEDQVTLLRRNGAA